MPASFAELLKVASTLGGGVAVVVMALAFGAWVLRARYSERLEAIRRANPSDLPKLVGDELESLSITAEKLSQKQRYESVLLVLEQRENRSRRAFLLAVFVIVAMAAIALTGLLIPRSSTPLPANTPAVGPSSRPPAPAPTVEGRTLFYEDFLGDVEMWKASDCADCSFSKGSLRVDRVPKEVRLPNSVLYRQFIFTCGLSVPPDAAWKAGLRVATDDKNMLFFVVARNPTGAGLFQLSATKGGTLNDVIPPTEVPSSRFRGKSGEQLSIRVDGHDVELSLNGTVMATWQAAKDVEGMLSILALSGTIEFHEVRVASLH